MRQPLSTVGKWARGLKERASAVAGPLCLSKASRLVARHEEEHDRAEHRDEADVELQRADDGGFFEEHFCFLAALVACAEVGVLDVLRGRRCENGEDAKDCKVHPPCASGAHAACEEAEHCNGDNTPRHHRGDLANWTKIALGKVACEAEAEEGDSGVKQPHDHAGHGEHDEDY